MKETIKKNVSLLKKRGRYCIFVMALFASIFCLIAAFFAESIAGVIVALAFSFINVCQAFDIIIDTRKDDSFQTMKEMYENAIDDLCISKHEVERLQQELESMKAEREKPKYRKPAPKRKPRTKTETENGNKENSLD